MRLSVLIAALAVVAPIGLCAGSPQRNSSKARASCSAGLTALSMRAAGAPARALAGASRKTAISNFFEACRRQVIQGNRGFCTQNPAFTGYDARPTRKKKHRTSG